MSHSRPLVPLTILPKLLTWGVWALCGFVGYHLGWMIFAPQDPSGTVSMWARSSGFGMVVQGLMLSAVVAAAATMLIGRILPDTGLFGACCVLAVVALRGETVSSLLTSPLTGTTDSSGWGLWFAIEAALWGAVVLAASAVSFLTYQFCFRSAPLQSADTMQSTAGTAPLMSGADLLALPGGLFDHQSSPIHQLKHVGITVVIGLVGVALFSMDLYARSIHHGQACFAVGLSFYIAARIAHEKMPLATPFLTLVGVPTAAIIGYLAAWVEGDANSLRTLASHVPTSVFLRTTPLLYLSVGSAAVLLGFWAAKRSSSMTAA